MVNGNDMVEFLETNRRELMGLLDEIEILKENYPEFAEKLETIFWDYIEEEYNNKNSYVYDTYKDKLMGV